MRIKTFVITALIVVLGTVSVSFAEEMDFKHLMGEIINSYLVIKSDLSADKITHVTEESKKIVHKAKEIEHQIKASVHNKDFHRFHKVINIHLLKTHAEKLSGQSLKDIRKHFKSISEIVVKYLAIFGNPMNVKEKVLYTFHCPMYDGGSNWVQANNKTANPFYGSGMLRCGSLKSVISTGSSGSESKHQENHSRHQGNKHKQFRDPHNVHDDHHN